MAAPPPPPLHMLFFPFVVPGHLLSMLDLARTFSRRGAKAAVITTPSTTAAARSHLRGSADDVDGDHPIELIELQHLPAAAPLPTADNTHMRVVCLLRDLHALRRPFQELLRSRRPDCVVSDMFLPWTAEAARELGVPRLVFHGFSVFSLCCIHTFRHGRVDLGDGEAFVIPDFPDRVELARSELPDFIRTRTAFTEEMERIADLDAASDGVVANSFHEMEGRYAEHFEKLTGKKAWLVGPTHLHSGREHSRVDPGGCLSWLDAQPPHSVVYVCFGSLCEFQSTQLREIAAGLAAASRCRFLWVVKSTGGGGESEPWMPEEEELDGRIAEGAVLVVRGWAPQVAILGHGAVGAFVTHCGWNSVMEAAAAGVPMLTWPLTAEQVYNDKLVTGVLGLGSLGVAVGRARVWTAGVEGRPLVRAEEIREAVERVMVCGGGEDEATKLRKRAAATAAKAHGAVGDDGSSSNDVIRLVHAFTGQK